MCYFEFTRILRRVNGVFTAYRLHFDWQAAHLLRGCKPTTNGCFVGGEAGGGGMRRGGKGGIKEGRQ